MAFTKSIIFKSFIWKLLERCSVQVVSFVVTIVLARILMPSDYGQIALVMVFVNLANVIVDGGLNQALIQKKQTDDTDFSTIFHVCMLVSLFLYGVMFVAAPAIAGFYEAPGLVPVIRVLSLSLPLYSFNSIQRAYISRHMLFKSLFKSSLLAVMGSGLVGILMAMQGMGVWALVGSSLSSAFLMIVVMWFTVDWKPRIVFSVEGFKSLFAYGWKIFFSNFIIALFVNIRSLIIGKVYTAASLAFFDRGKQFPSLIMENINASIQTVLFPVFSAEQENRDKVRSMVSRSIKMSVFVISPMMMALFAMSKPLIVLLLTEKWLMAVPFVRIFCIAYLLMPIQIANIEAIKSLGRSDVILKLELIKKVLEVTILVISVFINVYAIAVGVIIYNFICIFINLFPNKKLLDYSIGQQIKDVVPSLTASLVMGASIYAMQWIDVNNFVILLMHGLGAVVIYAAICYFFKLESFRYLVQMIWNFKKGANTIDK